MKFRWKVQYVEGEDEHEELQDWVFLQDEVQESWY